MSPRKTVGKDDEISIFYEHGLHISSRTIIIGSVHVDPEHGESGVDAHMWSRLEKSLIILEQGEERKPISIVMNNPGGDAYHMLAMYDRIRSSQCQIVIDATGHVMSAGSIILQAADVRRMHKHATMMIHHGTEAFAGHAKNLERWAEESKRVREIMHQIYLKRLRQKDKKFGSKRLKDMMAFDRYISAEEAVALGLADEIIPHTDL